MIKIFYKNIRKLTIISEWKLMYLTIYKMNLLTLKLNQSFTRLCVFKMAFMIYSLLCGMLIVFIIKIKTKTWLCLFAF